MNLNFSKSADGLLPVVVQDHLTGNVLMVGYMNQQALDQTRETGVVTFYSRSKERLWVKGETSGNFLHLKAILTDCDSDAILIKAEPVGPVCHTGAATCFEDTNDSKARFLNYLQKQIIRQRKNEPSESSYTSRLFARGVNKVAQKVGEEAVEVVIEAKDNNDDLFRNEVADLLFHLLVLLEQKNIDLDEVIDVLRSRHKA